MQCTPDRRQTQQAGTGVDEQDLRCLMLELGEPEGDVVVESDQLDRGAHRHDETASGRDPGEAAQQPNTLIDADGRGLHTCAALSLLAAMVAPSTPLAHRPESVTES